MKKYFVLFSIIFFTIFYFNLALIQPANAVNNGSGCTGNLCLANPLGVKTPQALIGKVITAVMGVIGSIALLMFIYGGLIWMTSSGNQEKVKKGRDIILWSAIGLVVIFMSYALTRFVLGTIAG